MKKLFFTIFYLGLFPLSSNATIIVTTGTGSAVTRIDATANFENHASLTNNPYLENGLGFSRVGLTSNNNGCGFAGCSSAFPAFSGNYFYGTGIAGFIEITSGNPLAAIEFILSNGHVNSINNFYAWEALLSGVSVGSGTGISPRGTVMGFSGSMFDTLRIANYKQPISSIHDNVNMAPAIDAVKAQFGTRQSVPEPAPLTLLGLGLLGLGLARKRRR